MLLIIFFSTLPFVFSYTWKSLFLPISDFIQFENVSEKCAKDTKLWLHSLSKVQNVTTECVVNKNCDILELLTLKNDFYAIQQLDAFGKPPLSGILEGPVIFDGSYQECERVSGKMYETNYCYLTLLPGKNTSCSNLSPVRTAVCMPKSCQAEDLINIFNQLVDVPLTACSAACSNVEVEKDFPFWIFTTFMIVIIFIAFLATFTDFIQETSLTDSIHKENSLTLILLHCFSFWTNAGILLAVKEQKPGYIKSLDCIRTFSMAWVVAGHCMTYLAFSDTLIPLTTLTTKFWNHFITNAFFSVDTFFLLSGLVLSYMFFKENSNEKTIRNPMTWIMFYVHRYLRLTPPMMLMIGFFTVYSAYIQGPFSASTMNEFSAQTKYCRDDWWMNLIYVNNFKDSQPNCYVTTWYLAVDTQLYVLAPIFIITLYYSFTGGSLLILTSILGSVITTYVLYDINNLPATPFGNGAVVDFYKMMYNKPWIRCTPYLIGILVGYLLAIYGKRKIRMNPVICTTLWLIAVCLAAIALFSTSDYDKGEKWSTFERATYYSFSRIGWAIAVSWVIVANHMGWGGPINNFMSHPIWQPFGRLSYCAYLVHWMVLFYFFNITDQPIHYYSILLTITHYAIPATVISYIAAFFWSCLFELPILKLEKLLVSGLMHGRLQRSTENKKLEVNGIEKTKI